MPSEDPPGRHRRAPRGATRRHASAVLGAATVGGVTALLLHASTIQAPVAQEPGPIQFVSGWVTRTATFPPLPAVSAASVAGRTAAVVNCPDPGRTPAEQPATCAGPHDPVAPDSRPPGRSDPAAAVVRSSTAPPVVADQPLIPALAAPGPTTLSQPALATAEAVVTAGAMAPPTQDVAAPGPAWPAASPPAGLALGLAVGAP
jgi:hypothetical protein